MKRVISEVLAFKSKGVNVKETEPESRFDDRRMRKKEIDRESG